MTQPDATGKSPTRIPGEAGIWVFICGDLVVFTFLFFVFLFYRSKSITLYEEGQAVLNTRFGLLNTLILLTSSWLVIRFLQAFRSGSIIHSRRYLLAAIAFGCGFAGVKYFEYGVKFSHGIDISSGEFFMFYFVLTGIHLLHVLVGIVGLLLLWKSLVKAGPTTELHALTECGAVYWHTVDLLWVVLFPLLYLI